MKFRFITVLIIVLSTIAITLAVVSMIQGGT